MKIISFLIIIAFLCIITFSLRMVMRNNWFFVLEKKWNKKAKNIRENTKLIDHVLTIALSLFAGVLIFILVTIFLLPKSLPLPQTTAINWLTVHRHSLTLDYIRFSAFVFIISVSIITGWFLFIWRKKNH